MIRIWLLGNRRRNCVGRNADTQQLHPIWAIYCVMSSECNLLIGMQFANDLFSMSEPKVSHLMTTKVVTLFEEQTLPLAGRLMQFRKIRHLPVVDDNNHVVGIVTHRDVLRSQISVLTGLDAKERNALQSSVQVKDIMNRDVWTVSQDATAYRAASLLADHRFGCLPVVDNNHHLVGIITDSDFLKFAVRVLRKHSLSSV